MAAGTAVDQHAFMPVESRLLSLDARAPTASVRTGRLGHSSYLRIPDPIARMIVMGQSPPVAQVEGHSFPRVSFTHEVPEFPCRTTRSPLESLP